MIKQDEKETYRSKLYTLQDEKSWEDQGTGFPIIAREDDKDILKFVLEEGTAAIYELELTYDLEFEKQDDQKVLTWYNPKDSLDMALSFQNVQGATLLYKRLTEILEQKKNGPYPFINQQSNYGFTEESDSEYMFEDFNLSIPDENTLEKFEREIMTYTHPYSDRKNTLCHVLCIKKVYFEHLTKIFRLAEAERNEKRIETIYRIFKILIQLSHFELYSVLLSDDYYMEVFGALEYDPEIKGKLKVSHRQYFKTHASFKQVANIKDETILRTIHWNFRLIYLRDSVIAHILDERVLQFLSAVKIIHSNYLDILRYIQSSRDALVSIFEALRQRRLNALKMIHEICITMKTLDIDRETMFDSFNEYGIFETLEEILQGTPQNQSSLLLKKKETKKKENEGEIDLSKHTYLILEIMMLSLVMAPHFLRDYSISQAQKITKYPFMALICDKLTSHEDPMIQNMLGEVIKHLIDTVEIGEDNPVTKLFYEQFLGKIIKIFDEDTKDEKTKNAKVVVIDLLMYCLKQQMNMIKNHIVALDVPNKLLKLFSSNDKFLVLSAVQNFRMIINIHDEAVLKISIPFLEAMTAYFEKYCLNKNNALHSAILEIYSLIAKSNFDIFIKHMVEHYDKFLDLPEVAKIGEKIKEKHAAFTSGGKETGEEAKVNIFEISKRGRPNLTIISPFGSVITQDNSKLKNLSSPAPTNGNSNDMNSASGVKRTSNAMQMDYMDEMNFNMDTKGKDPNNFMVEDLQLKKKVKSDEIHS